MTKNIQINVSSLEDGKNNGTGKKSKKKNFCTCSVKIKERLKGYEKIKNIIDSIQFCFSEVSFLIFQISFPD